jgi:peroxin-7
MLAVASSQYFGIVGNGKQLVLQLDGMGGMRVLRAFDTQDGLFDVSWNESNEHQLASASGDGSIKLWDMNSRDAFPVASWKEHAQECASVDWNLVGKHTFVTGSWDRTCKLWDPLVARSLRTFAEHSGPVYNAQWNPRVGTQFVSCGGDGTVKVWDVGAPRCALSVQAHQGEVLAVDWSKYKEFVVVTGATDRTVRVWDLRRPFTPVHVLSGHEYAIRRLKCSPTDERVVLSCSYDMTAILWDIVAEDSVLLRCDHHSEFVLGIDFNLFRPGQIATCSWDEFVCVFDVAAGAPLRIPPIPKKKPLPPIG